MTLTKNLNTNVKSPISSVMEKSKSHGRKSDKETHTPMLKIFKEIMQLEKNDPEKTNLLNEKERPVKKKQYSSSRLKSDLIINRSCDSSSSYRNGKCPQIIDTKPYDVRTVKTRSIKSKGQRSEDSCATGDSCALRRLVSSEYSCFSCLGLIFTITVVVAFWMVFKTATPYIATKTTPKPSILHKILKGINMADISLKEGLEDRNDWDDSKLGRFNEMSGFPGTDIDDSGSRGLNFGGSNNQFSDLSRIIDINKLNYGKSSERLKNFYIKLLRTDDQIKSLKKGYSDPTFANMKTSDRIKRSLKHHHLRTKDGSKNNDDDKYRRRNSERYNRIKRKDNVTLPSKFVIENKKILVQYPQMLRRKVPKCSHVPQESKSHEKELKHPFYKHTQRLDELLDQFIDKNLPNIFADPFGMDVFRKNEVKHTTHKTTSRKTTTRRTTTRRTTTRKNVSKNVAIIKDAETDSPDDLFTVSPTYRADSGVILGVTTLMSSPKHKQTKPVIERVPNTRRLMQVSDQDEDNLEYEDLREVLTDEMDSREDPEIKNDRNKRSDDENTEEPTPLLDFTKSQTANNPRGIPIPNWKGPLPLYPDELNTMIKHKNIATASKDVRSANQPISNDVQYVEDYLSNKLEQLAQAYSDYGVLQEKKPLKIENPKSETPKYDQRVKYSIDETNREYEDVASLRDPSCTTDSFSKFLNRHLKFIKGSPEIHFNSPTDENLTAYFKSKYKNSTDESKEGIRITIARHIENNLYERSLESAEDSTSNASLSNSIIMKKKTLETIDKEPKTVNMNDIMTVEVGTEDDVRSNDDAVFKIGYSLGKDDSEIQFKAPSNKTIQNNLYGNKAFSHRSLKSIDIDNTDHETAIVLNENITIEESMPEISTNKKYWTNNTFLNETVLDAERTKPTGDSETAIKNMNESFLRKDSTTDESFKGIDVNVPIDEKTLNLTPKIFNKSKIDLNLDKNAKNSIMDIVNLVNIRNNTKRVDDGMDLSDLFRMFSSWFSSLASVSLDNNDDQSEANSSIIILKTSEAPETFSVVDLKNTSDIIYPNYDSDMIDNIGHRSRVLMSIENVSNSTEGNKDTDCLTNGETGNEKRDADRQTSNSTQKSNNIHVLTTLKDERVTTTSEGDDQLEKNKTVVKRSLSDSGLVFWSDIYDDEYGIKVDPLDKEVNGKNAHKGKKFMKRSKNWLQDKVKSIAENIREFRSDGMKSITDSYDDSPSKVKRHAKKEIIDTTDKVTSFAELKVKMRSVCKEAAEAVQQTRKMQVRDSKEDSATNSIMRQLVRLMADLVDYQVKQKVCVKLPPDLQKFLEWLNANQDQANSQSIYQDSGFLDKYNSFGKAKDWYASASLDDKAEYLESLRSIEELIQQYGEMDDEEKSKMFGVRQYLENQKEYLTKQLAYLDELHLSNLYANQPIRIRRNVATENTSELKKNRIKRKLKRRLGKFLRNFGKKSTATVIYDDTQVTESSRIDYKDKKINNVNRDLMRDKGKDNLNKLVSSNKKNIQDYNNMNEEFDLNVRDNKNNLDKKLNRDRIDGAYNKNDKVGVNIDIKKRNLQDIYYRALSEAKKVTTVKASTD